MYPNQLAKQFFPVQRIDGVLYLVPFCKLDQCVSLGEAALSIGVQHNTLNLPIIAKDFPDVFLLGFLVNSRHEQYPALDAPERPRSCHGWRRRHFIVVSAAFPAPVGRVLVIGAVHSAPYWTCSAFRSNFQHVL